MLTQIRGRITTEKGRDPKFAYSANDRFNSYVESAIYLELFRDPKTQTTSLEFLKIWFGKEHFDVTILRHFTDIM